MEYSDNFCKMYCIDGKETFSLLSFDKIWNFIKKNKIEVNNHLDLVCGTGAFCNEMIKKNVTSVGIDISKFMIDIANTNKQRDSQVFFCKDMIDFCLENQFDLII